MLIAGGTNPRNVFPCHDDLECAGLYLLVGLARGVRVGVTIVVNEHNIERNYL